MNKYIIVLIVLLSITLVSGGVISNTNADLTFTSSSVLGNVNADINFLDTVSDSCVYSGSSNWIINNTFCNITISTNVLRNNLSIINSTVIINASVTNFTVQTYSSSSIVTQKS